MSRYAAFLCALGAIALVRPAYCASDTQKLVVGNMTISYPEGLESQAKQLAQATQSALSTRRKLHNAARLAPTPENIAAYCRAIIQALGMPEQENWIQGVLLQSKLQDLPETIWRDLRLYKPTDLKDNVIKLDYVQLAYDPATDSVHYHFSMEVRPGAAEPQDRFLPVLVGRDGAIKIVQDKSLDEGLAALFDSVEISMYVALTHEPAEALIVMPGGHGGCLHPFARWFNEGAANWIALNLSLQFAPHLTKTLTAGMRPNAETKKLAARVNLLTWGQVMWAGPPTGAQDSALELACYACATEAVSRMLADQPPGTLARIMQKLKGRQAPDTNAICSAIRTVTGKDARAILLDYVPPDVRKGVLAGQSPALVRSAKARIAAGDFGASAQLLKRAVSMCPDHMEDWNYLAYASLKAGKPKAEVDGQIRMFNALSFARTAPYIFDYSEDPDWRYVTARYFQTGGNRDAARSEYLRILKSHPDHALTRAALDELDKQQPTGH
jgi:tetratricopeptide (TPR) repeat protein